MFLKMTPCFFSSVLFVNYWQLSHVCFSSLFCRLKVQGPSKFHIVTDVYFIPLGGKCMEIVKYCEKELTATLKEAELSKRKNRVWKKLENCLNYQKSMFRTLKDWKQLQKYNISFKFSQLIIRLNKIIKIINFVIIFKKLTKCF